MVRGKRGWLKIVEAFVAIMLIMVTALIIIDGRSSEEVDISDKIYDAEIRILEDVVEKYKSSEDKETYDTKLQDDIDKKTPSYLSCLGNLCIIGGCTIPGEIPEKENIYVQSMVILEENKELKLYCWVE